ncbi:hypothetical protein LMG26845_05553 [Achromobacter insuavis]|uniref:Uncharacterized protein n=1 Tax=Achromobacter insuavis TaxID=1287735 RepID=A0A6J5BHX8_9BURK|nr:hypothetical protein LMG26845_05553 [Achromobacter insuavis]
MWARVCCACSPTKPALAPAGQLPPLMNGRKRRPSAPSGTDMAHSTTAAASANCSARAAQATLAMEDGLFSRYSRRAGSPKLTMAPTSGLGSRVGATTALTHQVPSTATAWPWRSAPTARSEANRSIAPIATGMPGGRPKAAAAAADTRPTTLPAATIGAGARAPRSARPAASNASDDQPPSRSASRPAVLASLASVAISPVRRKVR